MRNCISLSAFKLFTTNKRVAPPTTESLENSCQGKGFDLDLALHSMMNPDGGLRSGDSLTSQVRLAVWFAQLVIDTLTGGRGGPDKRLAEKGMSADT